MRKQKSNLHQSIIETTLKHLPGQHNQKRHGWRYTGGMSGIRSGMRSGVSNDAPEGTTAQGERDVYRSRIDKRMGAGKPGNWSGKLQRGEGKPPKSVQDSIYDNYKPAKHTNPDDFISELLELRQRIKHGVKGADVDSDNFLGHIYKMQGFDRKPAIVDGSKMDGITGEHTLYRGVALSDHVKDFQSGDKQFVGYGVYGNGTYSANRLSDARDYGDCVMKIKPHPKSKIGLLDDIMAVQKDYIRKMGERISKESDKEKIEELESFRWMASDPGRFAAMLGYDGYHVGRFSSYFVLLNRTALFVQDAYERPGDGFRFD